MISEVMEFNWAINLSHTNIGAAEENVNAATGVGLPSLQGIPGLGGG